MKLGTTRLINGHMNFLHIVKLKQYEQNIQKLEVLITSISSIESLKQTHLITKLKLAELKFKFNTLMPTFRNKRGIFNGLGTVIKTITGNMDANDALHLNEQIEVILKNENILKTKNSNQNSINTNMIERFENITKHINDQQNAISNYFNEFQDNLRNSIKIYDKNFKYLEFLNQINYNIDILYNHLNDISEAVILAKLSIISKHILSSTEIKEIHSIFKNQNIVLNSDEHIYELLKLQAYYNDTNIIFNTQIPILSNET